MGSVFIGLILLVLFVAIIVYLVNTAAKGHYEHEQREIKRAGNKGEEFFNERVKEILNENDIHLKILL